MVSCGIEASSRGIERVSDTDRVSLIVTIPVVVSGAIGTEQLPANPYPA